MRRRPKQLLTSLETTPEHEILSQLNQKPTASAFQAINFNYDPHIFNQKQPVTPATLAETQETTTHYRKFRPTQK